MARFEDGAASFAIDRFPAMDDDAIERFQIVEIERRRARREDAFAALELDYCGDRGPDCGDAAPAPESAASYLERTSSELLAELKDAAATPDRRRRAQDVLERRAEEDNLRHLVDLHGRTTYELDAIARDDGEFAARRALAKQLLDDRMALSSS